jgi:hypothetical protein
MRHPSCWLILGALALGACAAPLQQTPAGAAATTGSTTEGSVVSDESAASSNDLVCTTEMATGSRIPKKVCRSRASLEEERLRAEEFVRRAQQTAEPRQ